MTAPEAAVAARRTPFTPSDRLIGGGVFFCALLTRLLLIGQPIVVDEVAWLRRGARLLLALPAGDWAATVSSAHPGVTNQWLIAAGLAARAWMCGESPAALATAMLAPERYPALADYIAARVPFALVTALGAWAFYQWACCTHGRRIAALAALLLAFEPFWLAYNRVVTTDALQGNLMALSLLAWLRWQRGDGRRWAIGSGLLGGAAIATKLPALVLWPVLALWTALPAPRCADAPSTLNESPRARGLLVLAWGAAATAALFVLWPALWNAPVDAVARVARLMAEVELGTRQQFYLGQTVDAPGAAFYLLALLLRTSPTTLLIALIASLALLWPRARRALGDAPTAARWLLYLTALVSALTAADTKFDRYLIPAYPALALLAAAGLDALAKISRARTRSRAAARAIVALALAAPVFFSLPLFPDLLAFYSPLGGGAGGARRAIMVGNGEGLDQVGRWLSGQPGARDLIAASWYPSVLAPTFSGRTIELNQQLPDGLWPWATAHYVVFYVNQVQRRLPNDQIVRYFEHQSPAFVARLAGVDYAWAYAGPIVPAGPLPAGVQPLDVTFEGSLRLIGWEPPAQPIVGRAGGVRFYWEMIQPPPTDLSVYLGLRDDQGQERGHHDQPPVDGFLPLERWQSGWRVRDAQVVTAFDDTPPGVYALEMGLFSPSLGRLLQATDAQGAPLGDRIYLGQVLLGSPSAEASP